MGNDALVAPSGTVTVGGTVAAVELLLDRITAVPPAGAGAATVTVPVEVVPPTTVVGLSDRDVIVWKTGAGVGVAVGVGSGVGAGTGETVTEKARVVVAPRESVSRRVQSYVPAVVGVPPTRTKFPSGASWISVIPVGSAPAATVQRYGGRPALPSIQRLLNEPTVRAFHGSGVMPSGSAGFTVMVYVRLATRPFTSVARNVTVLAPATVGVPWISAYVSCSGVGSRRTPVGAGTVTDKPAGSAPAVIRQLEGPMPPMRLTVLLLTRTPTVNGPSSELSGAISAGNGTA